MGVRKKGRVRFECQGEFFVWFFENYHLRIVSEDKTFVIAYFLGADPCDNTPHLEIHGVRFPGIDRSDERPVRVLVPKSIESDFSKSAGAFVNALIRWSLDETHTLERYLWKTISHDPN